jgi:heme oxygenase
MVTPDLLATTAQHLKHHTSQQHQALEDVVLPQLHRLHSVTDYNHLLQRFYGYYKPVEFLIEQQIDEQQLPDIKQRRKADLILHDLTFSNAHATNLPLATKLPQLHNSIQAFGALYVLEGSTLGGRGITKLLLKNTALHLQPAQVQFFNGYGAVTGSRWMAFLERLNAIGESSSVQVQLTVAANETFSLFKKWLLENVE